MGEVDIDKVKVGQKAALTYDAASDTTMTGIVTWISPNAVTSSNVTNYSVDITPATQSSKLRPGMSANADIQTRVATNVLVVPNAAIKLDGTTRYVQVSNNGQLSKVVIKTGVADDSVIEVTSGLTEGQSVVNGTVAAASTTSSTSSSSSSGGGGLMMGGGAPPSGGGGPSGGN